MAALGLLKIANIRRAPVHELSILRYAKNRPSPPVVPAGWKLTNGPEINLAIRSCDSTEDELLDRYAEQLAQEQAEADRAREEELQTELEELQAAADARVAEEEAALHDVPEEEAA